MKLPTLILIVAAATLLLGQATPQHKATPAPKERIEESAKKIKELQKERIETLKKLVEQTAALFIKGIARSYEEALEAQMMLLQAELDAAEKESDRITACKNTINRLKQYEEVAAANVAAGRATTAAGLRIKARRLEAEIQLEQAEIKEAKESK
jgi:hypothetical protein